MMNATTHLRKEDVLKSAFEGYAGPAFALRLWDNWQWSSSHTEPPTCTLVVSDPSTLTTLLAHPNEISLGEAFIHGDLEVEGDLFSVFAVAEHLFNRPQPLQRKIAERLAGVAWEATHRLHHGATHSRERDRMSVSYHYDQPVAFFEPWLGPTLAYSCAYFENPADSLDTAQQQKLDLICRKLRLEPGERFLDIGCGWGSLVLHAAMRYHAVADGITLSAEQARVGQRRIAQAELPCAITLRDYRDLDGTESAYDKLASVGMVEHVGLHNLPLYFGIAHRILRPGGLFLNHGIARSATVPVRESSFVERFVFPDGRLVTLAQIVAAAESQGFEVRDVENLRDHYVLTLRQWVAGLQQNADALLKLVPRTAYRIWLLYTAGCAAAFRRGDIGVYQVLLSRPDSGQSFLPLTRNGWHAPG